MNLKANSYKLRQDILDIVYHAKGGHIGGDMSVIDTLNVLYNKQMNALSSVKVIRLRHFTRFSARKDSSPARI